MDEVSALEELPLLADGGGTCKQPGGCSEEGMREQSLQGTVLCSGGLTWEAQRRSLRRVQSCRGRGHTPKQECYPQSHEEPAGGSAGSAGSLTLRRAKGKGDRKAGSSCQSVTFFCAFLVFQGMDLNGSCLKNNQWLSGQ